MKDLKIGEVFEFEGKKLRVEKDLTDNDNDNDCVGCFGNISYYDTLCTKFCCSQAERSDKTTVVFVEVKED